MTNNLKLEMDDIASFNLITEEIINEKIQDLRVLRDHLNMLRKSVDLYFDSMQWNPVDDDSEESESDSDDETESEDDSGYEDVDINNNHF